MIRQNSSGILIHINRYAFLLILPLLFGCSSGLINLSDAKRNVNAYYTNGTYEQELAEVLDKAASQINDIRSENNSVVIFDLDETSFNNFEQIKKYDFGFDFNTWENWIQQGAAPPIVPVRNFYNTLKQKGFKTVFLTGRNENQYNATLKNLKEAGYAGYDTLIVRRTAEMNLPAGEYKLAKRNELTTKGYHIVMNVGDQASDFYGGTNGIVVRVPNYIYSFP